MIGFCRSCKYFAFTLDENKICRICRRLTEKTKQAVKYQTPVDDREVSYSEASISSEQSNDSQEGFFEGGDSGGGGASRDFSVDDSHQEMSSSDESNSDTGNDTDSDDSGSDSSSDSGGSDD